MTSIYADVLTPVASSQQRYWAGITVLNQSLNKEDALSMLHILGLTVDDMKGSPPPPMRTFPLSRSTDPDTSHEAEASIRESAKSIRTKLLWIYYDYPNGLTDEEVGKISGYRDTNVGYWKRCSDLRNAGLISWTGEYGYAESGRRQRIHRISAEGEEFLRGGVKHEQQR